MAPFAGSLVCPVLVGRVAQVDLLLRLAERAWAGRGQTAVIGGEAGIGKSRLVAEVKARLRSRQEARGPAALILQGRCFEPDRVLPYAPLLDLLQSFVASCPPERIATYLGVSAVEVGELLPQLSDFTPISASTGPAREIEQAMRLYHGLAQFFFRIAARQPLLLVIEDVQWSDDTSLDFLLYLARRIESLPIFLVLTCRSDVAHAGMARLLAALERERLAIECLLTRLSVDEVDAMVRAIFELGRPVRAEFLEALAGLTEGNPFFVEEILKSLVTTGDIFFAQGAWDRKPLDELRIPRSVQVAVQQRLAGLSPPARHLLDLAAVAGRRFDFVLLQVLTQQGEAELLAQVKELIAAQLVVEESAETFAFRHNLTRQAVYAALLGRERRTLHYSLAAAMEHVYAGSLEAHLGDLAAHFWAAEVWDKVLAYARRAAERAQALYAPRAAIEHWTHALEA
ncbi:MAG TPA: AAA family ATPase, partial [Chloroflexota bacterium]